MCELCHVSGCDCDPVEGAHYASGPQASGTSGAPDPNPGAAQGLTSNQYWGDGVASYGFPSSRADFLTGTTYSSFNEPGNFRPLSEFGRGVIRDAFAQWDGLSGLRLSEAPTVQAAKIHVGGSSVPTTAWAYYPGGHAASGDIWFNTNRPFLSALSSDPGPIVGSYAHATAIHEIGHALGLKHPHQASGGNAVRVPTAYDGLEYTVMSYRSYPSGNAGGYTVEKWGYPQSPMMLDIAALQQIYGANHSTLAGDTTYRVDPMTGEMTADAVSMGVPGANRVFRTLWDGNGFDRIDLSTYTTNLKIDLRPGYGIDLDRSGNGQAARLGTEGSNAIHATNNIYMSLLNDGDTRSLIEAATGGSGDDILIGNGAANVLAGGSGNDLFRPGLGADILTLGAGADTVAGSLAELDGITITDFDPTEDRLVVEGAVLSAAMLRIDADGTLVINTDDGGPAARIVLGPAAAALHTELKTADAESVITLFVPDTVTGPPLDPEAPAGPNRKLVGGSGDDVMVGGSGDDEFVMRWGNDIATGGAGADTFVFDWRYRGADDRYTITDLDFGGGDAIVLRFFDGRPITLDSAEALERFMARPDAAAQEADGTLTMTLTGSDGGTLALVLAEDGHTPVSRPSEPDATIDAIRKIVGRSGDDTMAGGSGDDEFILRWGNDNAAGGAGADTFVFDWRYRGADDRHTITDLNFDEGDAIVLRFFEDRAITIAGRADLDTLVARPGVTARTADGTLTLTLDDDAGGVLRLDLPAFDTFQLA